MRVSHIALMFAALLASGCGTNTALRDELQPQDFASGQEIAVPSGQPFFRFDLPEDVYSQTAWPDLRDIRVFNGAGEQVPFARLMPVSGKQERRRVALQSFRLESKAPSGQPTIELDTHDRGVKVRVAPGAAVNAGAEYLLAVVDQDLKTPITRLFLEWQDETSNWQQRVTVSVSSDLDQWRTVASARPLLDLRTPDGQRLQHGEIPVEPTTPQSARYWKLRFIPGFSPTLTNIDGEVTDAVRPPDGVRLDAEARRETDGSGVYTLHSRQPIARIRITPAVVNSVFPLLMEGREADDEAWQPIARTVAYRLNQNGVEEYSDPVPLDGRLLKAIRLRPLNTSWGVSIPIVEIQRDPMTLLVNARGAGPFLLAWGSRAADEGSVPPGTLMPAGSSTVDMPAAQAMSRRTLGGPERLTAASRAERAAAWQTTLVWIMLVGGAGALAFLAFRVWREARAQQSET